MSTNRLYKGIIERNDRGHCQILFYDREGFDKAVELLEGKEVEVTIRKYRSKANKDQFGYFHAAVLPPIAAAMGEDQDDAKMVLKMKFLARWVKVGDEDVQVCPSLARLDTAQFARFTDDCRRLAAEIYHLNIPDPQ